MEKSFSDKVQALESNIIIWFLRAGIVIGAIGGAVYGFSVAGIGGAIACAIGGAVAGAIGGLVSGLGACFVIAVIPFLILLFMVGAVLCVAFWIVYELWGVGKPQ